MGTIQIELSCELEDGSSYTVVADQRDFARWEVQSFGGPAMAQLSNAETFSMLFLRFCAWSAAFRRQLTTLTWAEYDPILVEAMPPEEDGDAPDDAEDPGRPARSGAATSPSPSPAGSP